jgi:hypothetical protein
MHTDANSGEDDRRLAHAKGGDDGVKEGLLALECDDVARLSLDKLLQRVEEYRGDDGVLIKEHHGDVAPAAPQRRLKQQRDLLEVRDVQCPGGELEHLPNRLEDVPAELELQRPDALVGEDCATAAADLCPRLEQDAHKARVLVQVRVDAFAQVQQPLQHRPQQLLHVERGDDAAHV